MMNIADVLTAFKALREDGTIVIPGRGGRHWLKVNDETALDVPLGDPAMGGHAGFGLGVAIAQPKRKVVLFDSEGDILMSLGMLATIAEQKPENFYHFLLDNEIYATTGGQPVPGAKVVDYAAVARDVGYPRVASYTELDDLVNDLPDILGKPGPVFVALKVNPEIQNEAIGKRRPWQNRDRVEVVDDLRKALTGGD